MSGSTEQPKVFISYSWTSPQHEFWVLELAERLTADGIFVVLDKWDLAEGQDKYVFMEKMVNDEKISKVLIVCDKKYCDKADARDGGVGTETQIISKEVYDKVDQKKFIALVKERSESGDPCLPLFIASRIYIDLSSELIYEDGYQKLIRALYERPLMVRPPLGVPPSYITDESVSVLKIAHKTEQVKLAIIGDKKNKNSLISDYFIEFFKSLQDCKLVVEKDEHVDDAIVKSIRNMKSLRDDFINFSKTVFSYDSGSDSLESFHDFFEKIISLQFKPVDAQQWREIDYDNYRFFCYELFLYFIALLINLKKYTEVAYFLESQYFFKKDNIGQLSHVSCVIFNMNIVGLDNVRKERLKLNRISVTADLIKERADMSDISFDNIIQADIILHYLTSMKILDNRGRPWFPRCSIYNSRHSSVELFERLVSKNYFDKLKPLFAVKSRDELSQSIDNYLENIATGRITIYNNWDYQVPKLTEVIDINKVATI